MSERNQRILGRLEQARNEVGPSSGLGMEINERRTAIRKKARRAYDPTANDYGDVIEEQSRRVSNDRSLRRLRNEYHDLQRSINYRRANRERIRSSELKELEELGALLNRLAN